MRTPEQKEHDEIQKRNTFLALMSLGAAGGAYEIKTIVDDAYGNTFSAVLHELGRNQPLIPLFFGLLNGHLWWKNKWTRAAVIVGFIVGAVFWWLTDGEEIEVNEHES